MAVYSSDKYGRDTGKKSRQATENIRTLTAVNMNEGRSDLPYQATQSEHEDEVEISAWGYRYDREATRNGSNRDDAFFSADQRTLNAAFLESLD